MNVKNAFNQQGKIIKTFVMFSGEYIAHQGDQMS
jgi:hypothetical protein